MIPSVVLQYPAHQQCVEGHSDSPRLMLDPQKRVFFSHESQGKGNKSNGGDSGEDKPTGEAAKQIKWTTGQGRLYSMRFTLCYYTVLQYRASSKANTHTNTAQRQELAAGTTCGVLTTTLKECLPQYVL